MDEYCSSPCESCGSTNVFVCKEGWECQNCGAEGITEEAPKSATPSGQAELAGCATHDFKCGVMWFEKEMLDYLQAKGWPRADSTMLTGKMAELVDRIVK